MSNSPNLKFTIAIIIMTLVSFNLFSKKTSDPKKVPINLISCQDTIKSEIKYDLLKNLSKNDSVPIIHLSSILMQLKEIDFVSGQIYHAGEGFPHITSTTMKGKGNYLIKDRITSGSIITFYMCKFKSSKDTILKNLNKSIRFM